MSKRLLILSILGVLGITGFLGFKLYAAGCRGGALGRRDFTPRQVQQLETLVHDYLLAHPEILIEVSKKLQAKEQAQEEQQLQKIRTKIEQYKTELFAATGAGRVVQGNPQGKILLVEFTQYQCGHCRLLMPMLDKLLQENPELQLITIYWPFFGEDAAYAAKAVLAAAQQKQFVLLHRALLASNTVLDKTKVAEIIKGLPELDKTQLAGALEDPTLDKALQANFKLASDLGLIGTPTLVFANRALTKFSLIPGSTRDLAGDLNKALQEVS